MMFKFEGRADLVGSQILGHLFFLNIQCQAPNVQFRTIRMNSESGTAKTKDRRGIVDVIAEDKRTGEVVLVMNEPNEWNGSDEQFLGLQERFNANGSFLLDVEMVVAD